MNLGSFMDPEYPIFSTTLCYLEREDAYLMLHRVKKQDDYNHDKWVGVGGKFERFESPEDCLLREVREETGLTLTRWRCRGLLTFILGNMTEFIHQDYPQMPRPDEGRRSGRHRFRRGILKQSIKFNIQASKLRVKPCVPAC